jgi:hypothetical protein
MQTRRFAQFSALALALLFTMLVGSVGAQDSSPLVGTWDVTLRFPESSCNNACNCPGNTPDIPIPTLNTFLEHGGMLWSAGSLIAGPGHGTWEYFGDSHFTARFKFFLFFDLTTGLQTGYEEVTKDIRLTGPDTFEATSTYDLFDATGTVVAEGCLINETASRFQ